jgi:hypothetical protein
VGSAAASPDRVGGTVVESSPRWGYGGGLIVTETVVEQPGGERVTLHQIGGRLGDIATVVTHTPPPLPVGAAVELVVRPALAPSGRRWLRVAEVLETSVPAEDILRFTRSTTSAGAPLFFEPGCAVVATHAGGASTVPGDLELAAIERSVTAWNQELFSCSDFSIHYLGALDLEPDFDGVNVVRFREDRWCRPGVGDDPEVCHDPAAAGLTFLTFGLSGDRNGAILDADIELNGVDFALAVDGQGPGDGGCPSEIQNTLTHELGHVIGLDHTCYDGIGPRPVTGEGNPAPLCFPEGQLPAVITEATMYPFQECAETSKMSLEADDIAGACAIYASAGGECTYPSFGGGFYTEGCAIGGAGGGGGGAAALVLLTALACSRSRRRSGCASGSCGPPRACA